VIDLTNTDKYYDGKNWGDRITHQKFKCPGLEIPPDYWMEKVLEYLNE
jgi:hypothetical protein